MLNQCLYSKNRTFLKLETTFSETIRRKVKNALLPLIQIGKLWFGFPSIHDFTCLVLSMYSDAIYILYSMQMTSAYCTVCEMAVGSTQIFFHSSGWLSTLWDSDGNWEFV